MVHPVPADTTRSDLGTCFCPMAIPQYRGARLHRRSSLRPANFVGLQNFENLFSDERFIYALTTSLVYVVVCVPLLTFLPLLLALLVHNKIPGIGFFRTTFYFPVIASAVVVAIVWEFLFSGNGTINEALKFLRHDRSSG